MSGWIVGASYENFTADLFDAEKSQECRYAVFDAEYEGGAGMQKNKILFFMWSVIPNHVRLTWCLCEFVFYFLTYLLVQLLVRCGEWRDKFLKKRL